MKLTCPACRAVASADAWANDKTIAQSMHTVANLPHPMGPVTLPYLALFRPEKGSSSWAKILRLVKELADLAATGTVKAPGKPARPCPARIWTMAMEQMLEQRDSLRGALKNHNYLKQVAWGLADQEDARQEQQRNQAEISGHHRDRSGSRNDPRPITEVLHGQGTRGCNDQECSLPVGYCSRCPDKEKNDGR